MSGNVKAGTLENKYPNLMLLNGESMYPFLYIRSWKKLYLSQYGIGNCLYPLKVVCIICSKVELGLVLCWK